MFLKTKTKVLQKFLLISLFSMAVFGVTSPDVKANHLGGPASANTGCGGTVTISKSASGSGTSPNGQISVNVSTTNACTGVYWTMLLYAHAGPNQQNSSWLAGWGTGQSQTFTFSNLSAGDYSVSGDAYMWWWNGSAYVYWGNLSTTVGFVTISNPPPPPPPPPLPTPVSPTLSGPSTANKGSTITHTWTSTTNTSYYMIHYKWNGGDWGLFSANGQITGISKSVATSFSNTSLAVEVVSCNSGGSCSWPPSNTITTTLVVPPPSADNCGLTSSGEEVCINLNSSSINVTQGQSVTIQASYKFEPTPGNPRFAFQPANLPAWITYNNPTGPVSPTGCFAITGGSECRANITFSTTASAPLGSQSVLVYLSPGIFTPDVDQTFTLTVDAPTVSVSLTPSPDIGFSPLNTTLTAVVGGTATGNITYTFDCKNGTPVQTFTTTNTSQTATCSGYTSSDVNGTNYAPTVSVTRQEQTADKSTVVSVYPAPTVDIKANNFNGLVSLIAGGSGNPANLTWTSTNASSCASSGAWGNFSKSLNNTTGESTGALAAGTYTYTLTCSNGGGASTPDSVTINVTNPQILDTQSPIPDPPRIPLGAPPCYGSPNPALVNGDVTWTANFTGGLAPYSYLWSFQSGTNTTNASPVSGITSYASPGNKTASVRVTSSDGQTINISCNSDVNNNMFKVYYPAITGTCSANKNSVATGEAVTWSVNSVSGGSESYTYSWSGDDNLSGNQSSTNKTYSTSGTKTATVRVTSGRTQDYPSGTNNYKDISCTIPSGGNSLTVSYPAVDVTCYPDRSTTYPGQNINWAVNYVAGGDGTYTYSWTGSESLSCSGQPLASCSDVNKSYSQTGTKTATVTANSGGLSKTKACATSVTVAATADPTASISATQNPVSYNTGTTVSWTSTNSSSCSVTKDASAVPGWTGTANNKNTGNLTSSAVYRVTCSGLNEKSSTQVSSEVRVKVTPTVTCSVSPTSIAVGSPVTWSADTANGGNGSYTYSWSGDESLSGSTASVNKTYSTAGGKNGTVTVTSDGLSATCSPVAGSDITVYTNLAVSCSASPSATTVNNDVIWSATPTGGKTPYSYSWSQDVSGNSSSVTKKFTSTGTKNGTVTVTSDDNQIKVCSATATISNKPSVSSFTTTDADIIQGESTTLNWSCTDSTTSSGIGFNTVGATSGSATVSPNTTTTYTVTCSNGLTPPESTSSTKTITVTPQSLSTTISISPSTGTVPLNVNITATPTSVSPSGNRFNYSFWKNCTNTTTSVGTANNDSSCGSLPTPTWGTCASNNNGTKCDGLTDTTKTVTLTYSSAGTFKPKVIVERGSLAAQANDKTVTTYATLSASCSVSPTSTTVNNNVTWSATNVTGGSGSYTYSWSGTDGLSCAGQPKSTCNSVTKSYSTTGAKSGTVTATSSDGQTKTCTPPSSVTISNKPSVSSFTTTDADIIQGESTTLNWSCTDSTTSSGIGFNTVGATSGSATVSPNTTTTYTVTCSNGLTPPESTSSTKTITVTPQSLNVSLVVSPTSGRAPLSVTVTSTITGNMPPGTSTNYSFWWNCNDPTTSVSTAIGRCGNLPSPVPGTCQTNSTGAKCDGMSATTQSLTFTYQNNGDYTAKVIAERGVVAAKEARAPVSVDYPILEPPSGQSQTKTSSANSPVTFSVQGGTGSYGWSAPNRCTPRTGTGSTFTVSCDKAGSYTITATSGTQSLDFTLIVASTILNFSANPPVVNPGQSSILSWLTTGYRSCSIDQGIGSVALDSGTKTLFYKEGVTQVTYTLTCIDNGNKQDASQVIVRISKVPVLKEVIPR